MMRTAVMVQQVHLEPIEVTVGSTRSCAGPLRRPSVMQSLHDVPMGADSLRINRYELFKRAISLRVRASSRSYSHRRVVEM
jgi:hypothetical protein